MSSYLSDRENVLWDEFILDLAARFKDEQGISVVKHFNHFNQEGTLEDFINEFESLKSLILQEGHKLSTEYMLESFIRGLKESVKHFVRALNPSSINEAIRIVRSQEEHLKYSVFKPDKFHQSPNQPKPLQAIPYYPHFKPPLPYPKNAPKNFTNPSCNALPT